MTAGAIVHIGYHKTATTWLQKCVFPRATSHEFVPRQLAQRALLDPGGLHFDAEQARRCLNPEGRNRPLLLSEENLSGYLHNGGLHGFVGPEAARRIKAVLPEARIVIFIRNQFDICRASYVQYVSGGGTWSEARYFDSAGHVHGALKRPWKAPCFAFEHFEFDRLVAHYDALFGAERVFVYPYEWLREPEALIARMQADLEITFDAPPNAARRVNGSLDPTAMTVLRGVNRFTAQSVANKDTIVDLPGGQAIRHVTKFLMRRVPGKRCQHLLGQRWQGHVAAHYPDSNRRLIALRDLPLAELGYPV